MVTSSARRAFASGRVATVGPTWDRRAQTLPSATRCYSTASSNIISISRLTPMPRVAYFCVHALNDFM